MNDAGLENYIREQVGAFPGKVAYLYKRMDTENVIFASGEADLVVAASTVKVPIMLCLLDKIKNDDSVSFDTMLPVWKECYLEDSLVFEYGPREASLYELGAWMLINSDNMATNVLMKYLGFDAMNAYFAEIGLTKTKVGRYMLDFDAVAVGTDNYISLQDFFCCMQRIYDGRDNDALLHTTYEMMTDNRDELSLMRYLYESPQCAHKTGGLDDIIHDAGIFEVPFGNYFLGVFVSELTGGEAACKEAEKLIGRISRAVYDANSTNKTSF